MEKIITLKRISDFDKYIHFDSFLIESVFSSFSQFVFNKEDILFILNKCHEFNKKLYLKADKILIESEIDSLNSYKQIFSLVDGLFFEDLSFITYFKKENINTELIYFPFDSLGDDFDLETLFEYGVSRICVPHGKNYLLNSKHLNKLGYKSIYREVLFYTRRKLLSLYNEVNGLSILDKKYSMQEKTRTSTQSIVETPVGTLILSSIEQVDFNKDISFIVYDSSFIDDEEFDNLLEKE